jgi:hypothetical protein
MTMGLHSSAASSVAGPRCHQHDVGRRHRVLRMAEHDGQRQFFGVVVVQRGFEHHARFARRQRHQNTAWGSRAWISFAVRINKVRHVFQLALAAAGQERDHRRRRR